MMMVGLDLEALYRTYGHSVLRRAGQILGSEMEAAEVLQELFTGLAARLHQLDSHAKPSTFLYAATTQTCLHRLRDRWQRRRQLGEQTLDEQVRLWTTDLDLRSTSALKLRDVLVHLADDEAHVAVCHYLDGMSRTEIAEMVGCSRHRVGDLLERIARRLAELDEAA